MAEPRRVISAKNLPMRMPLWPTLTLWLLLDRWHSPAWVWGALGAFIVFVWAIWLFDVNHRLDIDLLSNQRK